MKRLTLLALIPLPLVAGAVIATSLSLLDGADELSPGLSAPEGVFALPARAAQVAPAHVPIAEQSYHYDAAGYVDQISVKHEDGTTRVLSVPDALPTPTATVAPPTSAPSLTPSATAPATNTPHATMTPVPEATDTPAPTPTRESTPQPSPTPGGTALPKPSDCFATVMSTTGLNVRSSARIDGLRVGSVATGSRVEVYLVQVVKPEGDPAREEWGQIVYNGQTAWIALWYAGAELARLDDTAACWEVAS